MTIESPIYPTDRLFCGDGKTIRYTVVDAAGAAVNITGWLVRFTVAPEPGDTAVMEKEGGSGITLTTPLSGILDVDINALDTDDIPPGTYIYSLRRIDEGFEQTLAYGDFNLLPKVGL